MKTWLILRVDPTHGNSLILRASDDFPDLNDNKSVHVVSASIDVPLVSSDSTLGAIIELAKDVLASKQDELARELRKQSTIHLAALSQPKGKRFEAKLTET